MRGKRWWAALSAGALAAACGGSAVQNGEGSEAGASSSNAGASNNGAITPELRATGLPILSVLGQLDAASQSAVCKALGDWRFRLKDPICDAFVESAVVIMPRTLEEDRQLCVDNRGICHKPTEPTPDCSLFATSCAVTLAGLDQCYSEMERWFDAIPSCENMTLEGMHLLGPSPDSCLEFNTTCRVTID